MIQRNTRPSPADLSRMSARVAELFPDASILGIFLGETDGAPHRGTLFALSQDTALFVGETLVRRPLPMGVDDCERVDFRLTGDVDECCDAAARLLALPYRDSVAVFLEC